MCGAVPWGLLLGVSGGRHCVMGIAAGRVAGAALCRWACRVGGGVSSGLLTRASSGWRSVLGIADQGVVWVALFHVDCWWACHVGGAVSWGLLTQPLSGWRRVLVGVSRGWRRALGFPTTASSGWCRVFGMADQGLVAAGGSRRSGEPKRLLLKGRACTESSFLVFGPGPGVREVQNGSFLKAALVQNRHFWTLVRVRAFEKSKNGSFLKAALVQNRHFWALVRVRALERPG